MRLHRKNCPLLRPVVMIPLFPPTEPDRGFAFRVADLVHIHSAELSLPDVCRSPVDLGQTQI